MLNNDNYFSPEMQKKYFGVSQFKQFEQCSEMAMAELDGRYKREVTTSLLVGSYVDAFFEGSLKEFINAHPEIINTRTGALKAEYKKADEIIERLCADKMFMEYMSGEKQVIMTGEISGVPVKIKVDSLLPDKIVDLKIVKDFKPMYKPEQGKLTFAEYWEYDLQGAVYQEIVRQNTGKRLPFYLAAATKEPVTDLAIIEIPQDYLDLELSRFAELVPTYNAIKQGAFPADRCEHCNWCKQTKILTNIMTLGELAEYE